MWYYIDFRCIDHSADDAGYKMPLETTLIHAETEDAALAKFNNGMVGEKYIIEGVRHCGH
jgi:hypothetical protein